MKMQRPKNIKLHKIPLWEHQLAAYERASYQDCFALFFEVGTGKTATAINILRDKCYGYGRLLKTIIFCPPIVLHNWSREFERHSEIKDVEVLEGSVLKRIKKIEEQTKPKVFVTSYQFLHDEKALEAIMKWKPECLIFDESHKLKNMASKMTKAAIKIAKIAKYKFLLTGTPILNTPLDIFSQFLILDNGATFGPSFFAFRAKYFVDKHAGMPANKYFPNWQPAPRALEAIQKLIEPKCAIAKKHLCLDLPPLVFKKVFVELTPQQKRHYDEMKRDFITYVEGEACIAQLAMTQMQRLMQIASGFIPVENGSNIKLRDNPRVLALADVLRNILPDHKVLIWACWRENYGHLSEMCDMLGVKYVLVTGETKSEQKQILVDQFNNDPKVRIFIGHPSSAGIGVNLIAASYSVFYSRNFSLENDIQAEGRNYRGGSEIHQKITRIDIIAKDTIDEIISERLAKKLRIGNEILPSVIERLKESA